MKGSTHTLSSSDEMRLLAGLVVQPFAAAAVAFLVFPLLLLDRHGHTLAGGYLVDARDSTLSVALAAGMVAGVVTLAGVLPTAVWLMRRRRLTLTQTHVFGLVFGNFPYVLLAVAAGSSYGVAGLLRGVAFSSLLGLTGATLFWLIAIRPQTGHPNPPAG